MAQPPIANVQGLNYDSPVTQFPARSGPGTKNNELFKAQKGTMNLPVVEVRRDDQNTPNDNDKTQVYQWFKLTFPNGQTGWLRAHILTIQGDFSTWGYGVITTPTYAYLLTRDESKTGLAASQPATTTPATPATSAPVSPPSTPASTPAAPSSGAGPAATPAAQLGPVDDPSVRPATMITGTGAGVRAWNNYGGLVQKLAADNGVATATVLAILAIESGGSGFVNGRLKIRFENHIFRRSMSDAGRLPEYDANFAGGLAWNDNHQYRGADGQLHSTHAGQDAEWAALGVAQKLDPELAARAISMGAAQVMGFNYKGGGFPSAVAMLTAYSRSEAEHIKGMFNFLKNRGLIDEMQRNDFEAVALGYNGAGNVNIYGHLMRQAYEAVKPQLDAIGVK
jgi:hypothetical protein